MTEGYGHADNVIPAAGTVVWRKGENAKDVDVLLVHRPRYKDWTFPKGKLDVGEQLPTTAARETLEESAVRVRLGVPLPHVEYRIGGGTKSVSWWLARVDKKPKPFHGNKEVDKIKWLSLRDARKRVTYSHDRDLIDAAEDLIGTKAHRTRTLIVARHAEAVPRQEWNDTDDRRPLSVKGRARATELAPLFAAYGIKRVVTSPSLRCLQTLSPIMAKKDLAAEHLGAFAEDAEPALTAKFTTALLDEKKPTLLCTHRPVLPGILTTLGIETSELNPGDILVVHHRKGMVVAYERW